MKPNLKAGLTKILFFFILGYISTFLVSIHSYRREFDRDAKTLKPQVESINSSCTKQWNGAKKKVLSRFVYSNDPACHTFSKSLYAEGSFPVTPLISFPGSGNTWIRHLLELASGIYTGSIYRDLHLYSKGFLGELESADVGSTVVQKMHIPYSEGMNVSRGILLIRDPYKAIVSFIQYMEGGHLGQAFPHTFKKKYWPKYVLRETYNWISIAKSWIEAPSLHLLVVYYENLSGNRKIKELHKICNFLCIECKNLNQKCFRNHEEGEFHRKSKLSVRPAFPPWVIEKVNGGVDYLNLLLIRNGHSPLPLHHYTYYK